MTAPTDDFIEFAESAAATDVQPGTYLVTLTEISEIREITLTMGDKAGQTQQIRDWTFVTDDDQEIRDSATVSKSTRSKQYGWVTALLGGPAPTHEKFTLKSLIGREAIATVSIKDSGWPKVEALVAKPKPKAERAAAAAARQPVAAAAAGSDLPF